MAMLRLVAMHLVMACRSMGHMQQRWEPSMHACMPASGGGHACARLHRLRAVCKRAACKHPPPPNTLEQAWQTTTLTRHRGPTTSKASTARASFHRMVPPPSQGGLGGMAPWYGCRSAIGPHLAVRLQAAGERTHVRAVKEAGLPLQQVGEELRAAPTQPTAPHQARALMDEPGAQSTVQRIAHCMQAC